MFEVVIREIQSVPPSDTAKMIGATESRSIERYRQTVDVLDIRAVMAAVNQRPRKERVRKENP